MIRFEVTGETPEEFAQNAMSAWGLLAIGLHRALQPQTDAEEMSGSESSSTSSKADEVSEEEVDFAMELDRRGGLIREKIEERKKVHSDEVDDLFVLENPSFKTENPTTASSASSDQKAVTPSKSKTKGPKLDDLKTRLSEVIVAATERWGQKRANLYARKLLYAVGVEKLSALEPKCYDDFMQHSEIYLDGTAPE